MFTKLIPACCCQTLLYVAFPLDRICHPSFGRTEAEAPILWSPDVNGWLIGKDPDAGKNWRQKEKRATEDEMVGQHHWFTGRELGQTPRDVRDTEAWHAAVPGVAKGHDWAAEEQMTVTSIFTCCPWTQGVQDVQAAAKVYSLRNPLLLS